MNTDSARKDAESGFKRGNGDSGVEKIKNIFFLVGFGRIWPDLLQVCEWTVHPPSLRFRFVGLRRDQSARQEVGQLAVVAQFPFSFFPFRPPFAGSLIPWASMVDDFEVTLNRAGRQVFLLSRYHPPQLRPSSRNMETGRMPVLRFIICPNKIHCRFLATRLPYRRIS